MVVICPALKQITQWQRRRCVYLPPDDNSEGSDADYWLGSCDVTLATWRSTVDDNKSASSDQNQSVEERSMPAMLRPCTLVIVQPCRTWTEIHSCRTSRCALTLFKNCINNIIDNTWHNISISNHCHNSVNRNRMLGNSGEVSRWTWLNSMNDNEYDDK